METQFHQHFDGDIFFHPGLSINEQKQVKRRRYRIPRSCDRCRTSKIKCVFQDGQCSACSNARVPCTFANPGSLKERPPTQKDVEHLQARIRSLERLIHAVDPALDLSTAPELIHLYHLDPQTQQHRPSISSFTSSPSDKISPPNLQGNHDSQSDPALSSMFFPTQIKLGALATSMPYSFANDHGLSPADKIIRQECTKRAYWNYSLHPEPDLERNLLEIFFKTIHPCLPILHPATFLIDLQSGLSRTSDSFKVLCLAMMAVSSRFSKDPRVFLDAAGNPQHYAQAAGLRYAMIAGPYLFQPISAPANIHDLQAILIMVIFSLGAASPDAAWDFVGLGLQRAQEMGAHVENNPKWSNSPLQDHLRRKVFTLLYEFDCILSAAIGRPAYMQESDFDVLPHDLDFEVAIGTFTNPFDQSRATNGGREEEIKITNDVGLAYGTLKSSFGGLKNLLPLIDLMNSRKDSSSRIKFSSCIEPLINQLDASMTKCYEKISRNFSAHQSSSANVTDCQLISSVNAVTWYHEFRLLTHKVLFSYKRDMSNSREGTRPRSNTDQDDLLNSTTTLRHAEICIESARCILSLINRLHQRNLLELGFYWIPLRITNALITLIISLKKCGKNKTLQTDQRHLRLYEISLGLEILNALAPTTFLAEKCLKLMTQFQDSISHQAHHQNGKTSNSSSLPPFKPSSTSTASSTGSRASPKSLED